MTHKILPSLLAIALSAPAAATPGSVRDFQLPTPTPSAAPQVQGPVDTEGAVPIRPRVIPTATPTASAPVQRPAPAPTSAAQGPSGPSPTPSPPNAVSGPSATSTRPVSRQSTASAQKAPQSQIQTVGNSVAADGDLAPAPIETETSQVSAAQLPTISAPIPAADTIHSGQDWSLAFWLAGLAALIVLIGGAFVFWRRKQPEFASVPLIERPVVKTIEPAPKAVAPPPAPTSAPQAAPPAAQLASPAPHPMAATGQLQVKAQALSLSRSLMNATLAYRLELINTGATDLSEISILLDVVTAHGQIPVDQQIADQTTELPYTSMIAAIPAGEAQEIRGEFRVPMRSIRTISQGSAKLYVPLLRMRIEAGGIDTITTTMVIGIKAANAAAKLQPFRLDEMAQTYRNIGMRELR